MYVCVSFCVYVTRRIPLGRDGKPSEAILFHSRGDVSKAKQLVLMSSCGSADYLEHAINLTNTVDRSVCVCATHGMMCCLVCVRVHLVVCLCVCV